MLCVSVQPLNSDNLPSLLVPTTLLVAFEASPLTCAVCPLCVRVQLLDNNYLPGLLKWVPEENIPDWLGGKSKGTLVDDVGPWSDSQVRK
jgi:hypothetical protein